jgi:NTE family protein
MAKHKIGLTMSGGGVRGLAHVGVIRALEERDMEPTVLSGASAGSLVGALYAQGYTPDEICEFFDTTEIFRWGHYTWLKPGLIDTDKFHDIFKKKLPEDSFESLKKELYIVATDIVNGQPKIFTEGQLIKPILASAAFPVVLSPVEIDGTLYADGGIVNNFPVELIRDKCETLVGVYVNHPKKLEAKDLDSTLEILERAYKLNIAHQSLKKLDTVDIAITPKELSDYNTFDTRYLKKIHDIGYEAACKILDEYLQNI